MNLKNCHNFNDFRSLAKRKLPSPIFHYIDGAADDEITYARNTSSFDDVDLVPNVLRGVENVDLSTTIFGKKLDLPKDSQLGLSYNHLSNASLGEKNPGANSYMFNFLKNF